MTQFLTLFLFVLLSVPTVAKVDVKQLVSTSNMYVGDQFTYTLKISYPSTFQDFVIDDALKQDADFEIYDLKKSSNAIDNGLNQVFIYKLASFSIGEMVIPTMNYQYKLDGVINTGNIQSFPININSLLLEGASTENITLKGSKRLQALSINYIPIIIGLVIFVCFVFLIRYLVKKYQRKVPVQEIVPEVVDLRTPEEVANETLSNLRKFDWEQEESAKQFYFLLSETLKQYLTNKFNKRFMELTTTELISQASFFVDDQTLKRIKNFQNQSDNVKFACFESTSADGDVSIAKVEEIVARIAGDQQ